MPRKVRLEEDNLMAGHSWGAADYIPAEADCSQGAARYIRAAARYIPAAVDYIQEAADCSQAAVERSPRAAVLFHTAEGAQFGLAQIQEEDLAFRAPGEMVVARWLVSECHTSRKSDLPRSNHKSGRMPCL